MHSRPTLAIAVAAFFFSSFAAASPSDLLAKEAMQFSDHLWDERAGMPWSASKEDPPGIHFHRVREAAWYAAGLLERDGPNDRQRAERILYAVVDEQIDAPGHAYDGTFRRYPEEDGLLNDSAQSWKDFDPNWRQFIGTAFIVVLERDSGKLSPELRARLEKSVLHATMGELGQHRLEPSYSNIALMHAFMESWIGRRLQRTDLTAGAQDLSSVVVGLFDEHGALSEYNSPTYAGVDLYALALWRLYGSEYQKAQGARIEGLVWRDLADHYSPQLRNLAGPFDRAYGMDMSRYVSLVGVWMATFQARDIAPLPTHIDLDTDHVADFGFAPLFAALGAQIPTEALQRLQEAPKGVLKSRLITGQRTATWWIGEEALIGAEASHRALGVPEHSQYHPVTILWRQPDGEIAWLRLVRASRLDATASAGMVRLILIGDVLFHISGRNLVPSMIGNNRWDLPGLSIDVKTDAQARNVRSSDGGLDVGLAGCTSIELSLTGAARP